MNKHLLTGILTISLIVNGVLWYKLTHPPVPAPPSEEAIPTENAEPEQHVSGATYPFIRVVDGDTVVVGVEGQSEYVRFIGIDSPEPNDPGGPECYANEATDHLKELARTGTVVLHYDSTQDFRDSYGRLLAYVELPDGTDLGLAMLRDGYAREYTYNNTLYERREDYKAAESEARTNESGLWAPEACQ